MLSTGDPPGTNITVESIPHAEKYLLPTPKEFRLPTVTGRKSSVPPQLSNDSTLCLLPNLNQEQCDHLDNSLEINGNSLTTLGTRPLRKSNSPVRPFESFTEEQLRTPTPFLRRKAGSAARPHLSVFIPRSENYEHLDDPTEYSNTLIDETITADQTPGTGHNYEATIHSDYSEKDILTEPQATQDGHGERTSSKGKIQLSIRDQIAYVRILGALVALFLMFFESREMS